MRLFSFYTAALAAGLMLSGCGSRQAAPADIVRLDKAVAEYRVMPDDEQASLIEELEVPLGDYLYMMGLQSPDLVGSIDTLASSAAYKIFYPDVERRLPSLDSISTALGAVNEGLAKHFHEVAIPHYYGVISPFRQPIMLVDSMVFIALNHYLGADYEGYNGLENYLRRGKRPDRVAPEVAEAIISVAYPFAVDADDEELLFSWMLYDGAVLNAVSEVSGGLSVAELLDYSDDEMAWIADNETAAWQTLVASQMLFSSDPMDVERLCSPSPATTVISPDAPGRLGRYFGYRIVKSYLDTHKDATVATVLDHDFYLDQRSLVEAGFVPGR